MTDEKSPKTTSMANYDYATTSPVFFRSFVPNLLIFNLTVLEINLPVRILQAPKLVVIVLRALFDSFLVFKPGDFKIVISL
jgi:hypothetical protein